MPTRGFPNRDGGIRTRDALNPIHQLMVWRFRKMLIYNNLRLQYSRQFVLFRADFGE
jgi:hypothetical protein